jgi:hypothetical protein
MKLGPFHIVTQADLTRAVQIGAARVATRRAHERWGHDQGDMFALIAAVIEWRDARQPCLDGPSGPSTTEEGRIERQAMWGRYSKAEAALMALARKLGVREREAA